MSSWHFVRSGKLLSMPSVSDLVEPSTLTVRIAPANLRLGREIADRGDVELIEFGPLRVMARVGGTAASGQRRTVELVSTPNGLEWSCTCTRNRSLFCKHCVATVLIAWQKAPKRRG